MILLRNEYGRALYEKIVSQKVDIDFLLKSNPLLHFSKVIGSHVSKSSRTQLYIEDYAI